MAKFLNVPPTQSLKHYHLALRKVKKTIKGVSGRANAGILAATLLLGYFEVWSSDHEKWCKHLLGSRLVLKEIRFPEMTRAYLSARRTKREKLEEMVGQRMGNPFAAQEEAPEDELYRLQDPDLAFVSQICGTRLAFEPQSSAESISILSYNDKDIEKYEQLADLFWWYCKMDTYQSVLSGTKPFMEYEWWTQVAPRAPMARVDAMYVCRMSTLGRYSNNRPR